MKAEVSLGLGLATATLVYGVYLNATPPIADVRVGAPGDPDIAASERLATWTSAAAVAGVSMLAQDPTIFVMGGTMVILLAWWHRYSNEVDPRIGKVPAMPRGGGPDDYTG